ncbi:BspA family leucine-rich repeat surface protein [Bradymonas sediminis]|uniref:Uncharacterized protein n=1 Tax=Bradymonas sediminis TaxID=1548548 RepID=A0A2Z4FNM3_9DELT|nr:BspA family leucine-rich repeat surface protein [Bradymonas sediminis]AWV90326.1 hypothetical protein DN745_13705 [Bradymonas sediminis]TDP75698.1 uncharacterized protein DUF285 [Bradymonas sediminis]
MRLSLSRLTPLLTLIIFSISGCALLDAAGDASGNDAQTGMLDAGADGATSTDAVPSTDAEVTPDASGNGPAFVTRWKNADDTPASRFTVALPLVENGIYDFSVDWGDGNTAQITQWDSEDTKHTYVAEISEATITIRETIHGWAFKEGGISVKNLREIKAWGPLQLGETTHQFENAANLRITATDTPDLSATTSLVGMFMNAESLDRNAAMQAWDVSHITSMRGMFDGAISFNQPLGEWDIRRVKSMEDMFKGVTLSEDVYDQILTGWAEFAEPRESGVIFSGGNSTVGSQEATTARAKLLTDYCWTISDATSYPSRVCLN